MLGVGAQVVFRVRGVAVTSGDGATAGVVGTATPRFRLFGDTINTTARMSVRAQWGETVVSHAFASSLGLPPREAVWGAAGEVTEVERRHVQTRLMCDGPVPIKGKGAFCVWRLESSEQGDHGWAHDDDPEGLASGKAGVDTLYQALVQKKVVLEDEGSALARSMIDVAAAYEKLATSVPPDRNASAPVIRQILDMFVSRPEFEQMFVRYRAPHMLPAQLVHAMLVLACTMMMFGVDLAELLAARERGENVDLLFGIGISSIIISAVCTAILSWLSWSQKKQRADQPSFLVSPAAAALQDASAVTVWVIFIVFLELVHAFGTGENVPSWAYVIAGFLRAHSLFNLLSNGLALHPQPRGFVFGVVMLLAARLCSHVMWGRRAAAGQLVSMISAQCGTTQEWKPRGLVQMILVLVLGTAAYINRQLLERAAMRNLISAAGLRRRALEITSSLLPRHVIPLLEERAKAGSRAMRSSGNCRLFGVAEKHQSVIMLFADVVGFTSKCARVESQEVFTSVSLLFNALDELCREYQLTKIETIGDAYVCSHGLEARATPGDARRMLRFANAMRRVVGEISIGGEALQVRIGIHVGPMLGGIVGNRFPRYHLFGPHAKLAAVLEQAGSPDAPLVSDAFRRLLFESEHKFEDVQASGSSRSLGAGVGYMKSGGRSWNVKSWQAFPGAPEVLADGNDVPDELGPVTLETDGRGMPAQGVVLKRHLDIEARALEGIDTVASALVNPCWLAWNLKSDVRLNAVEAAGHTTRQV